MLGLVSAKARELPLVRPRKPASKIKAALKRAWIFFENTLPDPLALRLIYYRAVGKALHLNQPRTFTEKIQWLKLNYRLPIMRRLADKYDSRQYVAERLGSQVLNELYAVWDRPEDIDFGSLPDQFALKVTSASHANIFCRDKSTLNPDRVRAQLQEWAALDYYCDTREWAYKNGRPRIIAERLLDDGTGQSPADFKFYCFNGKPELIEVAIGRHHNLTITLVDLQWNVLPCSYNFLPRHTRPIPQPENLQEMIRYAEILAGDFPFARIDFYSIYGKTVFGEITWYPTSGLAPFQPPEFNQRFGDLLKLPPRTIR